MRLRARANTVRGGAGFTLVELILVIVIILILAAIAIPAYASLTYSSNQSGSSNAVQAALQSTRDAAVRAGSGRDAAAVFLVGDDGRVRIVVAEVAGTILDDAGGDEVLRDILVPAQGVEVFVLPRNWAVRGYARPTSLQSSAIGGSGGGTAALADNRGWYEDTYSGGDRSLGQWVFPETAYYDDSAGDNGDTRQSFMVRFEGGSGRFLSSATGKALYLDPAPVLSFRDPGTAPWSDYRVDREPDLGRFVRKVLADPTLSQPEKRQLLGDEATDTVLVGPVGQIAVYNEKRLANAIGADGVNRFTDTLYAPIAGTVTGPEYDSGIFGSTSDAQINLRIGLWMRASSDDAGGLPAAQDTSDARIFLVSRYLGQPIEAARLAEGR